MGSPPGWPAPTTRTTTESNVRSGTERPQGTPLASLFDGRWSTVEGSPVISEPNSTASGVSTSTAPEATASIPVAAPAAGRGEPQPTGAPVGTPATAHGSMLGTTAGAGALGGLVGGLVFGLMMQQMGMMPMIAMMVGQESTTTGWLVHMAISVMFGLAFGLTGNRLVSTWPATMISGLGYGLLLWVIGPLLLMPARLGMPLFSINSTMLESLLGHLIFGVIVSACVALVVRKVSQA